MKPPALPTSKEALVCIGRNIRLSGTDLSMVADLFLSLDGTVSVSIHRTTGDVKSISRFISRMGFPGLNMIASDYHYKTEGQAAGIIDIMARQGHITFSQTSHFTRLVEAGCKAPVIFMVGGDDYAKGNS